MAGNRGHRSEDVTADGIKREQMKYAVFRQQPLLRFQVLFWGGNDKVFAFWGKEKQGENPSNHTVMST